jgi:hypothetical protein
MDTRLPIAALKSLKMDIASQIAPAATRARGPSADWEDIARIEILPASFTGRALVAYPQEPGDPFLREPLLHA